MRVFFLTALSFSIFMSTSAQSFTWWANNVHWDGTTDWWKYLIVSPKYLGPNALTIPLINNGSVDSVASLGMTTNFHFSKGDKTQNLMMYGNYTTPNNTISVNAQFVPYERFTMTHATKEQRKVYYKNYYDNSTVGDVIMSTTAQILKKYKEHFQLALRFGIRMPSGRGEGSARYADVPAYWIDAGGAIPLKGNKWKWIAMAGFYVWQTNLDDLRQDDAFLFGTGMEWNTKTLHMQTYIAGYLGYLEKNSDKPVVIRGTLEKKLKRSSILINFQQGIHNFNYSSVEIGMKYNFKKIKGKG